MNKWKKQQNKDLCEKRDETKITKIVTILKNDLLDATCLDHQKLNCENKIRSN